MPTFALCKQPVGELTMPDHQTKTEINYPFVDFIRFISMMGIVFAHTDPFPYGTSYYSFLQGMDNPEAYIIYKQTFKFSVICFFMISGFLIGEKVVNIHPFQYFKRRLKATLKPYIIAFAVFVALSYIINPGLLAELNNYISFFRRIYYFIVGTPYWFLPTYLVALFTILLFNKYIDSLKFGAILLIVTAIYTFSTLFADKDHTTSVFAFIFYLWLGVYVRRKNLLMKIKKIKTYILLLLVTVTFILSCYEAYALFLNNKEHFFNNLRLFNQLYGLVFFILLVKVCPVKPDFWILSPRKETYGIYLYHFLFIAFIFPVFVYLCDKYFGVQYYSQGMYLLLLLGFVKFVVCYILTTLFVKIILRLKLPIL